LFKIYATIQGYTILQSGKFV